MGIEILVGVTVSEGKCKTYTLGHKGDVRTIVNVNGNISGTEYMNSSLVYELSECVIIVM